MHHPPMATARSEQIDLSVTPFYHCMTRCVRRAFLCGEDGYSGKNFDHRKVWVRDRLRALAGLFAIDVCAYAVMSNHLHVVLHVNEELAAGFDDDEVVRRYTTLYPMAKVKWELRLPKLERAGLLSEWRNRLTSISWLMRALSEFIARKANKEDWTRYHPLSWISRILRKTRRRPQEHVATRHPIGSADGGVSSVLSWLGFPDPRKTSDRMVRLSYSMSTGGKSRRLWTIARTQIFSVRIS